MLYSLATSCSFLIVGPFGNFFGGFVPARVLFGAEIWTVEDFLIAQDLYAFVFGFLREFQMLFKHVLFDLFESLLYQCHQSSAQYRFLFESIRSVQCLPWCLLLSSVTVRNKRFNLFTIYRFAPLADRHFRCYLKRFAQRLQHRVHIILSDHQWWFDADTFP